MGATKVGSTYRIPKGALENFINLRNHHQGCDEYDLFGNVVEKDVPARKNSSPDAVNWCDISGKWETPEGSAMTFVDCFCGAGGLSKGLELAGIEGVCGLDWFKEAGMTYERNFDHPFVNGDITLPETKEKFYSTVKERLNGRHLDIVAGDFLARDSVWPATGLLTIREIPFIRSCSK